MAILTVPKNGTVGLGKLASLSQEQVLDLLNALRDCPPALRANRFLEAVGSAVTLIDARDAQAITAALIGIYQSFTSDELASTKLPQDLAAAHNQDGEPAFSEENSRWLVANIGPFLSLDSSVGITAKAHDVFADHERAFIDARIITDIRPIFRSDPGLAPAGAAIVHMLKIEFSHGGEADEFYVAMDTSDVVKLKKLLERDELKAQQLKRVMADRRLNNLEE